MNWISKYTLIGLLITSCTKIQSYECVCYPVKNPENYKKYVVKNSYAESSKYCDSLSNTTQHCNLTK